MAWAAAGRIQYSPLLNGLLFCGLWTYRVWGTRRPQRRTVTLHRRT
jgi:hypothetical protein